MSEQPATREPHEPVPLAAAPEPGPKHVKDPSYVVLRREPAPTEPGKFQQWTELATLKASSRKAAIKDATAQLKPDDRGGEFAVILLTNWQVLKRAFTQRTVEEDVFA